MTLREPETAAGLLGDLLDIYALGQSQALPLHPRVCEGWLSKGAHDYAGWRFRDAKHLWDRYYPTQESMVTHPRFVELTERIWRPLLAAQKRPGR